MKSDNKEKDFKEFFYHDCDAILDDKIKAIYNEFGRSGRDLILNQIIPKLCKLGIDELELSVNTFYSFADPEIKKNKVKEIIEFCIYEIGLFNTDEKTFWNIRSLEHKLNRLRDNKKQSDKLFYGHWHKGETMLNPKYQKEIDAIIEILERPLYRSNTVVIPETEKEHISDTVVIPAVIQS
jgi:hypothetical protein